MTAPCHNGNLQQAPNTSSHRGPAVGAASHNRQDSGQWQAESTIQAIEAVFGLATLLTCSGYGAWLVFWSTSEVLRRATFQDFIRCFS